MVNHLPHDKSRGRTSYSWDIENPMVGVVVPDATLNTMSYYGDGKRGQTGDSHLFS